MSRPIINHKNVGDGAYSPPMLTIYGNVKVLTASGTSGVPENGNQPNCSTGPTKRPC